MISPAKTSVTLENPIYGYCRTSTVRFTPESGHPLKALEKTFGAPLFTRLVDDGSWTPLSNAASKVCNVPLQLIEREPNRK